MTQQTCKRCCYHALQLRQLSCTCLTKQLTKPLRVVRPAELGGTGDPPGAGRAAGRGRGAGGGRQRVRGRDGGRAQLQRGHPGGQLPRPRVQHHPRHHRQHHRRQH